MPTFNDFNYYFCIDQLGISKEFFCIIPIFASFFCIFNPVMYQKVFSKYEYSTLFMTA